MTTKSTQASARAAAAVADGHVAPAAPTASAVVGPDTVAELREREVATLGQPAAVVDVPTPTLDDRMAAALDEPAGKLIVVCARPGFRAGGMPHPSRAEYPLDFFTAAQLGRLRREPLITLVEIGGTAIPRSVFGAVVPAPAPIDPVAAGRAAEDAITRAPNRSEPGMRNALAGTSGFVPR